MSKNLSCCSFLSSILKLLLVFTKVFLFFCMQWKQQITSHNCIVHCNWIVRLAYSLAVLDAHFERQTSDFLEDNTFIQEKLLKIQQEILFSSINLLLQLKFKVTKKFIEFQSNELNIKLITKYLALQKFPQSIQVRWKKKVELSTS